MNAQLNARKAALEKQLSRVCGATVEITIRGLREFTLTAEGDTRAQFDRVREFLAVGLKAWEVGYDEECAATFAYFTL